MSHERSVFGAETASRGASVATEVEQLHARLTQALIAEGHARRRLDDVLRSLDAGILLLDAEGRIVLANPAASTLTGTQAQALPGAPAARWLGAVARNAAGEVRLDQGSEGPEALFVVRRDMAEEAGAEVVLLSNPDCCARARGYEQRLARVREMFQTLGQLAHKINNPLTALLGRAQILQMKKGNDPDVCKAANVIEESARRIASAIQELVSVVRGGREGALAAPLLTVEPPRERDPVEADPS